MNLPSNEDADNSLNEYGESDFANDLLKDWDAEKPSKNKPEEDETEETETDSDDAEKPSDDEDEGSEETDSDDDGSEKPAEKLADENAVIKVKVDGTEHSVKVADLARLYGQEASITRKTQEVAAVRKQNEDVGVRYVAATENMIRNAYERYQPYEGLDWDILGKTLSVEEYKAVRDTANAAYRDIQFLTSEMDGFMKKAQTDRQTQIVQEAREAVTELTDPVRGIPGFNEELSNEMFTFAKSQNIPDSVVNEMTAPWAWKLVHKAMMYERGKSAKTKVVDKSPKNIVTTRTSAETTRKANRPDAVEATKSFRETGSVDDFAKALLQNWKSGK